MYTVMPFMGMVAKPTFGAIADRCQSQKKIFLLFILVTIVGFLGIYHNPDMPLLQQVHFACDDSETVFDTCVNNFTASTCAADQLHISVGNETVNCKVRFLFY